jgi:peptidoglycan/xylan/chitin deacetylase (PgdA/CDA1 family)
MEESSPFMPLNKAAIFRMAASGLIEFGGHGHRHGIFGKLATEEQRAEIDACAASIHQLTGQRMKLFSYPNGAAGDFDATTIELLRSIGVRAAVTMIEGPNNMHSDLMALRRYDIGPATSFYAFQRKVHHLRWW